VFGDAGGRGEGPRHALVARRLGRVAYDEAHNLQQRLVRARQAGAIPDTLLLLEHPAVVTLGRAAKAPHLLLTPAAYAGRGIELHEVGRGGDVTFHGPGQVVAYPIVDLSPDRRDVRKYVQCLEEAMLRTCAEYGLAGQRVEGLNGAWLGDKKVGAVGVRISRWVTMHGLALNANVDLGYFDTIVPCGIADRRVTSLAAELGHAVDEHQVQGRIATHLARCLDASLEFEAGLPDLPPE